MRLLTLSSPPPGGGCWSDRGRGRACWRPSGDDLPPRIHPVNVGIVEGHLLTVVLAGSAKAADLAEDGRYALHAHQDPAVPHEFSVRGRASVVTDPGLRSRAAAGWAFTVPEDALVLDLGIEHALLGERPDADAWPPVYRSWRP